MIDQQGRQQNLEQDDVSDSALGKVGDQLRLEQLHNTDGEKDQLLVPFELRREHGQPGEKDQPDGEPSGVEPGEPAGVRVDNGERAGHAASIQPQKPLCRQLEGGFLVASSRRTFFGPHSSGHAFFGPDIRISNREDK